MKPTLQRVRKTLKDRDVTGYLGELEEFAAAVVGGRKPQTPPEDGRRDVEIVARCYEALASGVPTSIAPITTRESQF